LRPGHIQEEQITYSESIEESPTPVELDSPSEDADDSDFGWSAMIPEVRLTSEDLDAEKYGEAEFDENPESVLF
jgi:hypothetical protein